MLLLQLQLLVRTASRPLLIQHINVNWVLNRRWRRRRRSRIAFLRSIHSNKCYRSDMCYFVHRDQALRKNKFKNKSDICRDFFFAVHFQFPASVNLCNHWSSLTRKNEEQNLFFFRNESDFLCDIFVNAMRVDLFVAKYVYTKNEIRHPR